MSKIEKFALCMKQMWFFFEYVLLLITVLSGTVED